LAFGLLAGLLFAVEVQADDRLMHTSSIAIPTTAASITFLNQNSRESLERFAQRLGLGAEEIASRYGASGVIRCGHSVGTAQLVLAANVIATAAHNLFDMNGRPRGDSETCRFEVMVRGVPQVVSIELAGVRAGSNAPFRDPAIKDWAVAPLTRPIVGVRPYAIADKMALPTPIMLFAAARPDGNAASSIEACTAHRITNAASSGERELAIDCSGDKGTSGAAMLTPDGRFAGIYVGFRSRNPWVAAPFSEHHYNFGLTVEGAFRRALIAVAKTSPEYTGTAR
jgi:hypothetical protein